MPGMKWLVILLLLPGALAMTSAAKAGDAALTPAANAAFLADSAKKPGTVLRASGLQYRVQRSGTGRRPGGNDVVRIAYKVSLIDGTVVDATTPVLPASLGIWPVWPKPCR